MQMTPGQILTQSSNVGAIQIAAHLGKVQLDRALRRFGLGSLTAPSSPASRRACSCRCRSTPTRAWARSRSVTASRSRRCRCSTCTRRSPTAASRVPAAPARRDDRRRTASATRAGRPPGTRVVSATTAAQVTQMLEGVVRQGTGVCAAVTGFDVAGKTGTVAQARRRRVLVERAHGVVRRLRAGRSAAHRGDRRSSTTPTTSTADAAAAPVFSEIMQSALRSERVVPPPPSTNPPQWIVAAQAAAAQGTSCRVPHGAELANR